ncbi:MAG: hypothetical protein J6J55_05830 [Paludibacteraceae bacterium]|nr:hypothetical protein [Paludibacteraceae bacterium]
MKKLSGQYCREVQCPFYYKPAGKAACKWTGTKRYVKHLQSCPKSK